MRSKVVKRRPQPRHSRLRRMATPSSAWRESTTRSSSAPHHGHRTPPTIVRESGRAPLAPRRSIRFRAPSARPGSPRERDRPVRRWRPACPLADDVVRSRRGRRLRQRASPQGPHRQRQEHEQHGDDTTRTTRRRRTRGVGATAPGGRVGRTASGGMPRTRVRMRPTSRLLSRTPVRSSRIGSRTPVRCQPGNERLFVPAEQATGRL